MILAFLAQSILHALVAAVFVEALLRRWRIEDARVAAPAPAPRARRARRPARPSCSSSRRSARARGSPPGGRCLPASAGTRCGWEASGSATSRCSCPAASARRSSCATRFRRWSTRSAGRRRCPTCRRGTARPRAPAAARGRARRRARHSGARRSAWCRPRPRCCSARGSASRVLVVSPATLERLRGDELDAAVAHELAHAAHHDPAWGYALIAVRAALFFNPAVQWVARAMVDDIERRADQVAVRSTGGRRRARPRDPGAVRGRPSPAVRRRRVVRARVLADPQGGGRAALRAPGARRRGGADASRAAAAGDGRRGPDVAAVLRRLMPSMLTRHRRRAGRASCWRRSSPRG